eukprot:COSAG06_NODE_5606_length_3366_cov_5.365473_2_plen_57_part_00
MLLCVVLRPIYEAGLVADGKGAIGRRLSVCLPACLACVFMPHICIYMYSLYIYMYI